MKWLLGILTAIGALVAAWLSAVSSGVKRERADQRARDAESNAKVEGEKATDAVKAADAAVVREKVMQEVKAKDADAAVEDLNDLFGGKS